MISLDITDEEVLRRTLEELDARIPTLNTAITQINSLDELADLATTIDKVNEVVRGFNNLVTSLELSQ